MSILSLYVENLGTVVDYEIDDNIMDYILQLHKAIELLALDDSTEQAIGRIGLN